MVGYRLGSYIPAVPCVTLMGQIEKNWRKMLNFCYLRTDMIHVRATEAILSVTEIFTEIVPKHH